MILGIQQSIAQSFCYLHMSILLTESTTCMSRYTICMSRYLILSLSNDSAIIRLRVKTNAPTSKIYGNYVGQTNRKPSQIIPNHGLLLGTPKRFVSGMIYYCIWHINWERGILCPRAKLLESTAKLCLANT